MCVRVSFLPKASLAIQLTHLTRTQISFSMNAKITGGTGAFTGATGVVSYSGRGAPDFSDYVAYVTVVSSQGDTRKVSRMPRL